MQFLNSLVADNRLVTLGAAIAAFLVFAVLILVLLRLLFGNRLRVSGTRGRQQRLGVVDSYDMDRQRQLVLVRRDNTEHLVMIGGPNDVLIESSIIRVERAAPPLRDAPAGEVPTRLPVPDTWAAEPEEVPTPPPPPPLRPVPPLQPAAIEPHVEPARVEESLEPPPPTRQPEIPAAPPPPPSQPRAPIFMRMRGRAPVPPPAEEPAAPAEPAPPPAASEPPPAQEAPVAPTPATPAPPLAEADFFETEIAKALAPSLRNKPPAAPAAEAGAPPPPAAAGPRPMPFPPRPPLRPFPLRRETSPAGEGEGGVPRPPRPAPPFFSRMTQRAKDTEQRVEPPVAPPPPVPDVAHEPAPPPPAPPQPVEHAPEPPVAEARTTPPAEPPAASPPPEPHAPEPAAEPTPDADDSFEEEMARLLGRAGPKDK